MRFSEIIARFFEILARFSQDSPRFSQDSLEILARFSRDYHEILPRFSEILALSKSKRQVPVFLYSGVSIFLCFYIWAFL